MKELKSALPLVIGIVIAVVFLVYPEAKLIACRDILMGS